MLYQAKNADSAQITIAVYLSSIEDRHAVVRANIAGGINGHCDGSGRGEQGAGNGDGELGGTGGRDIDGGAVKAHFDGGDEVAAGECE